MRRLVPVLLSLILVLGGLCSSLCLAQAAAGSDHSCCHQKNHCAHAGPTLQSHQAVEAAQQVPVILTSPVMIPHPAPAHFTEVASTHFANFSPPLLRSVLRL